MNGFEQEAAGFGQPSYKIVIDLGESLGQFYRDLSDPIFDTVQDSMDRSAAYIARGMVHSILNIPGALTLDEAEAFFPSSIRQLGRQVVEAFWSSLSAEISRAERMLTAQYPGQVSQPCFIPEPTISGHNELTIWYRWVSGQEIAQKAIAHQQAVLMDDDPTIPWTGDSLEGL